LTTSVPAGVSCHAKAAERPVADVVQDDVVVRIAVGEVVRRVVNDVVRADRTNQLDISSATHAGDLGTERGRDLDGVGADPAGGAVDQEPAARPAPGRRRRGLAERSEPPLGSPPPAQRSTSTVWVRSCPPWLGRTQQTPLGRIRAPRPLAVGPVTFVPTASTCPAPSTPAIRSFGLLNPTPRSRATRGSPAQHVPVVRVEGGRMHANQHVIGADLRHVDVGHPEEPPADRTGLGRSPSSVSLSVVSSDWSDV